MSDVSEFAQPQMSQPALDGLAEGNLFVELQVPSWPPPVTQTLLRNRDARSGLTIRAKPSGRLRVELVRAGYPPLVVRTVHLRLRAPGLLRLNVAWRGDVAAVAAGGRIIGSSSEAIPDGVASPETIEETIAPLDHVGNQRACASRRQHVQALLQGKEVDGEQLERWVTALDDAARSLSDLVELVRQRRHHHLAVMVDTLVRLTCGDGAVLQQCAGLFDVPLTVYASPAPPQATSPALLLAAAFDVAAARGPRHEFAVDLDVWLHHEHPWLTGRHVPVEALLLAVDAALAPPRFDRVDSEDDRVIRASFGQAEATAALCAFATVVCAVAASVVAAAAGTARTSAGPSLAEATL
ncbi:MAG: hypothetical protein K2X72_32195 [Reyranella sp.]|nr:hypothetical protein [Reyranella sp.]